MKSTGAMPFITVKLHRQMIRHFSTNKLVRAHPFQWNENTQQLELVHQRKLPSWYFSILVYIVYVGFWLLRSIHVTVTRGPNSVEALTLQYMTVLNSFCNLFQFTIYKFDSLIVYCLNNAFDFIYDFARLQHSRDMTIVEFKEVRLLEYFLDMTFYGFWTLACLFSILAFVSPNLPVFVTSVVENPGSWDNFHWRIIAAIIALYVAFVYLKLVLFFEAVTLALIIPMVCTVSSLSSATYVTRGMLRDYVKVEILGGVLNAIFSPFVLPAIETMLIFVSVYGFVGSMRTSGFISTGFAACGSMAYFLMLSTFRILAETDIKSGKMLSAWKSNQLLSKRTLASLRPWRILVGSYYFVDVGIILTISHIVTHNTVSLILVE